jgi:heptaprenyl diphosphate synthase
MGDYLFARAVTLMNMVGNPRASHHLTTTITQMCQGEISQQEQAFMLDLTEAQYITRIRQKTASFFASACAIGACCSPGQTDLSSMLYQFGDALGLAYQVLDDLLDLTAPIEAVGKPVGNDLLRGTLTLPVIYGLHHERWGKRLAKLIMEKEIDLLHVNNILTDCGAYTYTLEFVTAKIEQAEAILAALPDHPAKNCLSELGQMILAKHTQYLKPVQLEKPFASGIGV